MNELENRLKEKLEHLYKIAKLYSELNQKTKYTYDWRSEAINAQIDTLEQLRDNTPDCWMECYREDLAESNLKK